MRKTGLNGDRPTIGAAELWSTSGCTREIQSIKLGYSTSGLQHAEKRLGFRRTSGPSPRYVEGPCVECGEIHEELDLDEDRLCVGCVAGPTPEELFLDAERRLARDRKEEREAGIRPPLSLGQPRTPVTRISTVQAR